MFNSRARIATLASASVVGVVALGACSTQAGTQHAVAGSASANSEAWVVGLGDSYMSGEGGRWATNTAAMTSNGGYEVGTAQQVYGDTAADSTSIYRGCHRANGSAPMEFNDSGWQSENLACSGAQTFTVASAPDTNYFKPGVDFAQVKTASGKTGDGQATQLQEFAKTHNVKVITLSIGGNNAGFADVTTNCVTDYLIFKYCSDQKEQTARVTPEAQQILVDQLDKALDNIHVAMTNAGYDNAGYRVVYQLPPEPVANGEDMKWKETYSRASSGGCGFYNHDITWMKNKYMGMLTSSMQQAASQVSARDGMQIVTVDNKNLFNNHLLCQKDTTRMEGTGVFGETPPPQTRDTSEWVRAISIADVVYRDDQDAKSEAMHPMYWGQRALAQCNEAAATASMNNSALAKYGCTLTGTYDAAGQPQVTLTPGN